MRVLSCFSHAVLCRLVPVLCTLRKTLLTQVAVQISYQPAHHPACSTTWWECLSPQAPGWGLSACQSGTTTEMLLYRGSGHWHGDHGLTFPPCDSQHHSLAHGSLHLWLCRHVLQLYQDAVWRHGAAVTETRTAHIRVFALKIWK